MDLQVVQRIFDAYVCEQGIEGHLQFRTCYVEPLAGPDSMLVGIT